MPAKAEIFARLVTVDINATSLKEAIDLVSVNTGIRISYDLARIASYTAPIRVHVAKAPLGVVFDHVLSATRLKVICLPGERLAIVTDDDRASATRSGTVSGHIRDANTGRPVQGATVWLDGATKGVMTDEDGAYRFSAVPSGAHTLSVKRLGYARQQWPVAVTDDATVTRDMTLEPSTNILDQVVVTGTVIPTELRSVPNAMTIITAKEIEQRGITRIDQFFRGDVPGLFAQNDGANSRLDEVTMFSRGATALGASAGTNYGTNPIKTYIDGVEMADPQYLSQIDPKSIERIEILTGPQASTIYGSNALNGVMQVFTKRGTAQTPQLTLNLMSGFVQNNFSNALTPQYDHGAQVNGIEGRISYNAGGAWEYMGPWTPAKQMSRINGFAGMRFALPTAIGAVSADLSLRRANTQNKARGYIAQLWTDYQETGWYKPTNGNGLSNPTTYALSAQTLGLVVRYVPTSWWSQEVGIGQDVSENEGRYTTRGYQYPGDTTLFLYQIQIDKRSLRYTTTARIPVTSAAQATVTVGADGWKNLTTLLNLSPQTMTGTLIDAYGAPYITRQPDHNAGGFLQAQLGVQDRLFLTYGLRAEWNPEFGADAQPNYAPRYGIAYTQDVGPITAKVRASYGRSTRPPAADQKNAVLQSAGGISPDFLQEFLNEYGNIAAYLANPVLAPEHQQGGEAGLELYLGTHGSLAVTRYNQTVDDLIDATKVDSARSLIPNPAIFHQGNLDANGYGYWYQYAYLNVGSIRNQGWELQGTANVGPFTTHGTYSWTKSRTIGVNPKYRSYFSIANGFSQYQPGATFNFLPEHTWAAGVTYTRARTTVAFNISGIGRITQYNSGDELFNRRFNASIRLPQNRLNVSRTSAYISSNSNYALADMNATWRFSTNVDGVLQVQNLTDHYTNDHAAYYATMGRQVKTGLRIRFQ